MSLPPTNTKQKNYLTRDIPGGNYKGLVAYLAPYFLKTVEKALNDIHKQVFDEALTSGKAVDLAELARWRLEEGAVVNPDSVPDMLADAKGLLHVQKNPIDRGLKTDIFVYAALSVVDLPTHPAHCAFWAKNSWEVLTTFVGNVYVYSDPKEVLLPIHIDGPEDLLKRVTWWQRHYEKHMASDALEHVQKWMAGHLESVGRKHATRPGGKGGLSSRSNTRAESIGGEERVQRIKQWQGASTALRRRSSRIGSLTEV
ncbi:hypothetical protein C8T65DRAFT_743079 [Cerioporus squamosus]|nr:hypothetical protein C8T65DRAFT_743079 [Cerioporus squamosus]